VSDDAARRELEELREHVARRAQFVAILAHDVRTPLASIVGSVHTLEQRGADLSPEQRSQLLAVIGREADRLANLLAEAFDTARIDTGTFNYSFAEIDMAELVAHAVDAANARGESVVRDVEPALPVVNGDAGRLRQVLSNLIENAVKFSGEDDPVEVSAVAQNGRVLVAVTDHGQGIPLDEQERIFEQFGRVSGTDKPGSGLGLFIARAIAEAHGGTLEVSSAPGEGATFTLALPAA
jgi:signal transduction histidine kinase